MIIQICLGLFILLELSNVIALYFKPEFDKANAMASFKLWEDLKDQPQTHDLLRYMVYWVAGTKLIFIALIAVIILFASPTVQFYALIATILTILTYYWKLSPLIKKMDQEELILPNGYSQTLNYMIGSFAFMLTIAGILNLSLGI